MKTISLTKGKFAIVDDEDYEHLMQWKWYYASIGYAVRLALPRGSRILMHRVILTPPIGMVSDHINGDRLDNRRCNLRVCTYSQNMMNKKKSWGNSRYKGVSWSKKYQKWEGHIMVEGKKKFLGYFDTEEVGALAYNEASMKLHGEFGCLNKVAT